MLCSPQISVARSNRGKGEGELRVDLASSVDSSGKSTGADSVRAEIPERNPHYVPDMDDSLLIDDPVAYLRPLTWTQSEKLVFLCKFLIHPLKFPKVAEFIPNKNVHDCIRFYYADKISFGLKALIEEGNPKKLNGNIEETLLELLEVEPTEDNIVLCRAMRRGNKHTIAALLRSTATVHLTPPNPPCAPPASPPNNLPQTPATPSHTFPSLLPPLPPALPQRPRSLPPFPLPPPLTFRPPPLPPALRRLPTRTKISEAEIKRIRNCRSSRESRKRRKVVENQLELDVHHARIENSDLKARTYRMFAELSGLANAIEKTLSPEDARKKHPQLYEALAAIQNVMDNSPWTYKDPSVPEISLNLT